MLVSVLASGSKGNSTLIKTDKLNILIDIGMNLKYLKEQLLYFELQPKDIDYIFITHTHKDHVGALDDIQTKYPNAVLVDYKTKEDKLQIGTFEFKKIETFGHSSDSVSYYFDNNNVLFTGDFVFKETIGNIEENLEDEMANSLNVFKYMPESVVCYPGHGESTKVGHELKNNPFLRGI